MITKQLTSLHAQFAPLSSGKAHRISRIFLSLLPGNATMPLPGGLGMKVSKTILGTGSSEPARLVVELKGGERLVFQDESSRVKPAAPTPAATAAATTAAPTAAGAGAAKEAGDVFDLGKMSIADVVEELDRRSRRIGRAEDLS